MQDPFRKLNQAERNIRKVQNAPKMEMRQMQQKIRWWQRMPGMKARRMKNQALQPMRQLQAQQRQFKSQGRRYKRYGKRMSGTDFTVSAMMYPIGIMTLFGGAIEDWDTEFIRYNLVHARMLWLVMIILFPISPILWLYSWFLGFRAYSGKKVRIPILTNWAEKHGKLNIKAEE